MANTHCKRISPHVAVLTLPYLRRWEPTASANIYLIIDKELVLIDAGPWGKESFDILSLSLDQLGFSIRDISRVIYTHAHADHMGGGVLLAKEGGFSSSIYRKAIEHVEQYGRYVQMFKTLLQETFTEHLNLYPEKKENYFAFTDEFWRPTSGDIKIDHGLDDGEVINTGTLKLKVISTPGHSPWDISLWEEEKGLLFSGDFVLERSTTFTGGLDGIGSDLSAYESSLKKIDVYLKRAQRIFPSHGPPIGHGAELAKKLFKINKLKENRILMALSEKRRSLVELANFLSPELNMVGFIRQIGVVLTHLEKLEKEGKIHCFQDGPQVFFALK